MAAQRDASVGSCQVGDRGCCLPREEAFMSRFLWSGASHEKSNTENQLDGGNICIPSKPQEASDSTMATEDDTYLETFETNKGVQFISGFLRHFSKVDSEDDEMDGLSLESQVNCEIDLLGDPSISGGEMRTILQANTFDDVVIREGNVGGVGAKKDEMAPSVALLDEERVVDTSQADEGVVSELDRDAIPLGSTSEQSQSVKEEEIDVRTEMNQKLANTHSAEHRPTTFLGTRLLKMRRFSRQGSEESLQLPTASADAVPPTENDVFFYNVDRAQSLLDLLSTRFGVRDETLARAITSLGEAAEQCATIIASSSCYISDNNCSSRTLPENDDAPLPNITDLHVDCNNAVFANVQKSQAFAIATSGVNPEEVHCSEGGKFSLSYDALDGSSIVDANMAVGSIFGIWSGGEGILNRRGREQVASAVAIYGPRTSLCIALSSEALNGAPAAVFEITLVRDRWELTRERMRLQEKGRIFAPGNLRAVNENANYRNLVNYWMEKRYSLRYSGGTVPDIYHMLTKSRGVFAQVSNGNPMAKLRLIAPIAFIVESAGGEAIHDEKDLSVLHIPIKDLDERLGFCMGSKKEVSKYIEYMFT